MTLGQWVGQWFGEWFGSGEPAPEGSLSGTATVGLTCTGPATAIGHLTGGAVITIASAGELSSATSGSLSGVATITLSTTGAITSANTRPSTSEYPFFSAGFWSAGFFSAGFWGGVGVIAAKSGVSRLFYYQLQEAELKKREQKQREAAPERESSRKKKVKRKSAPAPAPITSTPVERPPTRLRPIYTPPPRDPLEPLLIEVRQILAELRYTLAPKYGTIVPSSTKEDASNDPHAKSRLLLLLAA